MDRDYFSFDSNFESDLYAHSKTETIRFNLQEKPSEGEILDAVLDTGEVIGVVEITAVEDYQVNEIPDLEFTGHENYSSTEEVLDALDEYYHDTITPESIVTVISFEFKKSE